MGAELHQLATIGYFTDTDTNAVEIGEPYGLFNQKDLKEYVKKYGHEKLCAQLTHMQWQVWTALRDVNEERESESVNSSK